MLKYGMYNNYAKTVTAKRFLSEKSLLYSLHTLHRRSRQLLLPHLISAIMGIRMTVDQGLSNTCVYEHVSAGTWIIDGAGREYQRFRL